jgi:hypothetical protein
MSYGTIKVDTITFTDGGVDKSVSVSGLTQNPTITGNLTVTGTISGDIIEAGTSVSGVTVLGTSGTFTTLTGTTTEGTTATFTSGSFTTLTGTTTSGTTANFVSGVFSTSVSGATVQGTAGDFATITGGVTTITSGVFALGTNALPSISFSSDPNTGIYSPGADQVAISTNGTERVNFSTNRVVLNEDGENYDLRIESSTNANFIFADASANRVGIGTSSPVAALHVYGNATDTDTVSSVSVSQMARFDINGATNSGFRLLLDDSGNVAYLHRGTNNGDIAFSTRTGNANYERLRITSDGKLGLGTSSPSANLEIGTASGSNTSIRLNSSTSDYLEFSSEGTAAYIVAGHPTTGGANLGFKTTGSSSTDVRMYITSDGKVGIGTTSPDASSLLDVNGAINISDGNALAWGGGTGRPAIIGNNANDNIAFYIDGSEACRLDPSGRLLVGTTSARTNIDADTGLIGPRVQVEGTDASGSSLSVIRNTASATTYPRIYLGKTRGGSLGANTIVQDDDGLGELLFNGADGTNLIEAASIKAEVDGTPGANDMPGRLVFSTTADSASSPTERMRIDSSGRVGIGTTSPSGKLTVDTKTAATNAVLIAASTETGRTYGLGVNASASFVIHEHTAASDRLVIDSSGRLLVGTSTSAARYSVESQFQVSGASRAASSISLSQTETTGTEGGAIYFWHSDLDIDDSIGLIQFGGAVGGAGGQNNIGATIEAIVDGVTYSGGDQSDLPTRLVFSTTADGASSPTERMTIKSDGKVGLGTSSPSARLHVVGPDASGTFGASETTGVFSAGGNQQLRLYVDETNKVSAVQSTETGVASRALLLNPAGGNVGIGVTGPQEILEVRKDSAGASVVGALLTNASAGANTAVGISFAPNVAGNARTASIYGVNETTGQNATALTFYTNANGGSGTEKARIDSSGRLLVGTSSARTNFNNASTAPQFQVEGLSASTGSISVVRNSTLAGPVLRFGRTDGTSVGDTDLVGSGDDVGQISFQGSDGTEFVEAATITAQVDGTPGANDMPGRLVFSTTADGASSPTERMRITNGGSVLVGTTTAPNSETFAVSGTAAIEGLNGSTVVSVSQSQTATVTYTLRSKESGMMIVTYAPSSTQTDWGASGGDGLYLSAYFGNLANTRANVITHDAGRASTARDGAISITDSGGTIIVSKTAGSASNAGDLSIAIISAHQIRQPVVT